MNKLRLYFQGVMSEVKKVTFPSQEETKQMTILVVAVSLLIAAYVLLADLGFGKFVNWLFAN